MNINAQAEAAQIVQAIGLIIKEVGSIPSGHLYAQLMAVDMNLSQYNVVIDLLKRSGLIKVENHLITWIEREH